MLIRVTRVANGQWNLAAYVWCDEIASVTDYTLGLPSDTGRPQEVARLERYSRWSEPASGLVARLLTRSSPGTLAVPAPGICELEIRIGRDLKHSRQVESLTATRLKGRLQVSLFDDLSRVECSGEGRQPTLTSRHCWSTLADSVRGDVMTSRPRQSLFPACPCGARKTACLS